MHGNEEEEAYANGIIRAINRKYPPIMSRLNLALCVILRALSTASCDYVVSLNSLSSIALPQSLRHDV